MKARELTRSERAAIRSPVRTCANFDCQDKICLILDDPCYMLGKVWTGAMCRYFREAVLPTNPALEAVLTRTPENQKKCPVCGNTFIPTTSQAYCSDRCRVFARRKSERERKRRERQSRG